MKASIFHHSAKFPIAVLGVALFLGAGCGDDEGESSIEQNGPGFHQIAESEVPEIEIPPAPETPAAQAAPAAQAEPVKKMYGDEEDETAAEIAQDFQDGLDEANDALEAFVDARGAFPKSMTELIGAGELSMAPRVPPGKALKFDRERRKFVFIDK